MADRFVVTGSGRCGTRYVSALLTAAGVPCGHEAAHSATRRGQWPASVVADSSWMAATMLDAVDVPVVMLVRHPLAVVRSFVEIGFFSHDLDNRTHAPIRAFAPYVYDWDAAPDRALAMWLQLNLAALARAELVVRLEHLDAVQLGRLLRWSGAAPSAAKMAFAKTGPSNRHQTSRDRTRITHRPVWSAHDPELATQGEDLAAALGYDPEVVPGG